MQSLHSEFREVVNVDSKMDGLKVGILMSPYLGLGGFKK